MKNIFYILVVAMLCFSCGGTKSENTDGNIHSLPNENNDSIPTGRIENKDLLDSSQQETMPTDTSGTSLVDSLYNFYDDELFKDLELKFDTISKTEFDKILNEFVSSCSLAPSGLIKRSDLYTYGECDEVCEDFLVETKTGRKIMLPSSFDTGIIAIETSPSCDKFIVYSSYDRMHPYGGTRSSFFVFSISSKEQGLKAVKPLYKYYASDWSIDYLTWINNNSIAIKIYEEERWGDGSDLHYKYIKAVLK